MSIVKEYILIPNILLNDEKLNNTDLIPYGCLYSLTGKHGYCFACNKTLSNLLRYQKRTINYSLSRLKKENYINITYIENNIKQRRIYLTDKALVNDNALPKENNSNYSDEKYCKYNNIKYKSKDNSNSIISYDVDGIMLWNGKRCESEKMTLEEQNEMRKHLKEFNGGDHE